VPQLPVPGEEIPAVLAVRGDTLGHPADELHHQREVVLVTVVVLAAPGVEEKVTGGELEGHARQGPHVRRCGVLGAQYNLRAPVLPGLDVLGELLVRPARVAEVHDDSLHRVDVLGGGRRAPSFLFVTGSLLLLLPGVPMSFAFSPDFSASPSDLAAFLAFFLAFFFWFLVSSLPSSPSFSAASR
jgi:hypothetical protein